MSLKNCWITAFTTLLSLFLVFARAVSPVAEILLVVMLVIHIWYGVPLLFIYLFGNNPGKDTGKSLLLFLFNPVLIMILIMMHR